MVPRNPDHDETKVLSHPAEITHTTNRLGHDLGVVREGDAMKRREAMGGERLALDQLHGGLAVIDPVHGFAKLAVLQAP